MFSFICSVACYARRTPLGVAVGICTFTPNWVRQSLNCVFFSFLLINNNLNLNTFLTYHLLTLTSLFTYVQANIF